MTVLELEEVISRSVDALRKSRDLLRRTQAVAFGHQPIEGDETLGGQAASSQR